MTIVAPGTIYLIQNKYPVVFLKTQALKQKLQKKFFSKWKKILNSLEDGL